MRNAIPVVAALLVSCLSATAAWAQPASGPRTADVASPEAIVAALYDVISGPAGQTRDWDRFKRLFAADARLVPAAPRKDGSAPVALTPDGYVQRTNDVFLKSGFFEREACRNPDASRRRRGRSSTAAPRARPGQP